MVTDNTKQTIKLKDGRTLGYAEYGAPQGKLPKTGSGKIMRRVLKAVAGGDSIGELMTLEDEASVAEIVRSYRKLERAEGEAK